MFVVLSGEKMELKRSSHFYSKFTAGVTTHTAKEQLKDFTAQCEMKKRSRQWRTETGCVTFGFTSASFFLFLL